MELHICRHPQTLGWKGTNDCFVPRNFSLLSKLRALSGYTEKLILSVKFSMVIELWASTFIAFTGKLQVLKLEKSFQAGFFCVFFLGGGGSLVWFFGFFFGGGGFGVFFWLVLDLFLFLFFWRLQLSLFFFPSGETM